MLSLVLATLVAYLIGSLSFAVIISRVMGLDDPRSYGSQNPGATNVLRSGNRKAALLTLLFDALKGWFPVFLVKVYGERWELPQGTLALVALGAFVGHLWPVFFRFVGGKGVATAAGVLFGLNGWLGLATMATWLIVALFSRYSSLAALAAAIFAPAYYWLGGDLVWPLDRGVLIAVSVMSALLLWRHRLNITRL
ncbi:MAG: glycerol-3-phosphate 1-O-acyltransferase PlsY, partial [Betaproteobacteria bacterium]|nr:glycerol-3-phosphate 1-O-acyltransferase PlsY [Betaproteobacteria bacterium]